MFYFYGLSEELPAATVPSWFSNLSVPSNLRRPGLQAAQQQAHTEPVSTRPETTTVDRWFQPLSTPVFARSLPKACASPALIWSTFTPAVVVTVTVSSWFAPFSNPLRQAPRAYLVPPPTGPPNTSPETTTVDRWYQPLSVPPVLRRTMPVAQQQAHTEPVSLAAETVSEDRWHQPLSLPPVLSKRGLSAAAQQSHTEPVSISPETTTVDRWFAPLGLPVWPKPALAAARQLAFTAPVLPQPDAALIQTYPPLSTPTPRKAGLPASAQQAHTEPVSTAPETVTEDRWHQPLSLPPVLAKPGLKAAQQQFYTAPASTLPESVSLDRWQQPLSVPVPSQKRQQPAALTWSGFTPPAVAPVTIAGWLDPFPDFARKAQIPGAFLGAYVAPVSLAPETTTLDRWFQPLSLPQPRPVLRIQPAALTWSGFTPVAATTPFGWFQPLSNAIVRRRVQQPAFAAPILPLPDAARIQTYPPLTTLAPPKLRLLTAQQQPHTEPVSTSPEATTLDRWYQSLSLPVRRVPALLAGNQRALFWSTFTPAPPAPIAVTPGTGSLVFTGFAPTITQLPSGLFSLSNSDILIEAFGRIGVQPPEITRHHLLTGRNAINLEVQSWTNESTTQWSVVTNTVQLVPGQATYQLPANMVDLFELTMLDTYGNTALLLPMERSQYAAIANKLTLGVPTFYWLQKLRPPQITLWQVPAQPNVLTWYGLQQIQDSNLGSAEVPNVPYRGIDALCARVAVRLCEEFGPKDRRANAAMKKQKIALAKIAWEKFQRRDQEQGPTTIRLMTKKYRRIR